MTVASEILRIKTAVADAYTSCSEKGATLPASQVVANLASTIDTISGGGDVATYGMTIKQLYGTTNSSGVLSAPSNIDLVITDIKDLAENGLQYAFQYNTKLRSVIFSDLAGVSNQYAMRGCFRGCSALTSVSFPVLESITGHYAFNSAFINCTALTSVSFPALRVIGDANDSSTANSQHFTSAFNATGGNLEITFPELTAIYCNGSATSAGTFRQCTKIAKLYFPKLTTISPANGYSNAAGANQIFNGCSNLTEIHFASANQSAIEASTGYATAWGRGASNVTIYFDL